MQRLALGDAVEVPGPAAVGSDPSPLRRGADLVEEVPHQLPLQDGLRLRPGAGQGLLHELGRGSRRDRPEQGFEVGVGLSHRRRALLLPLAIRAG